MKKLLITAIFLLGFAGSVQAKCNAKFLNPVTEVCWDCIFPISIGALSLGNNRPDTANQNFPLCACWNPFPRIGLSIGLWEPARLVDVANEPGCFVNMGFEMDMGLLSLGKSSVTGAEGDDSGSTWQAHYYYYPLISWLGTIIDGLCLETTAFDVAYISEIDPLWNDIELNNLLNPEAILFANPIAQSACAAECVAASSGSLSMDTLFWCNGCQGALYPIAGEVNSHYGGIMASQSVAARLTARMHRLGLARATASSRATCGVPSLAPVIPKSQYRMQVTRPRATTSGRFACAPIGSSTQFVDAFREYPYLGGKFWMVDVEEAKLLRTIRMIFGLFVFAGGAFAQEDDLTDFAPGAQGSFEVSIPRALDDAEKLGEAWADQLDILDPDAGNLELDFEAIRDRALNNSRVRALLHADDGAVDEANVAKRYGDTQVPVLASFAMPDLALQQLMVEAEALGVPVLFRGFVNNSVFDTRAAIESVFGENYDPVGFGIDPTVFTRFDVETVPRVIVLKHALEPCETAGCEADVVPAHDLVVGNIPLRAALELVANQGEEASEVARHALTKEDY